jgi:chondroitin AC lyase
MVVPATSVAELEQNPPREKIAILANTTELQAVRHSGLGMFQVVFYRAGEVQLTDGIKLACDSPGIVMLRVEGHNITEISVSDPNRELARLHLRLSAKIQMKGENFEAVWNEDIETSEVVISLPRGVYAGKGVTVDLRTPDF